MRELTERQLHNRLEKYYEKYYGERETDEWANNPSDNEWLFIRDGKIITLICDKITGNVTEKCR